MNIKRLLIFFFATLIYALCQMLFSIILMKEELWHNFQIQLSAHYIVILAMCIADYGLLLFLNKHLPYSKNIFYRIVADIVGITVISFILMGIFNYLIYEVLLVPQAGMPSFLVKFAFAMTTNIPILLVFELIHYFQSEQKAIADSEIAKRKVLLFQHETLRAQINPHFLFNSLNVLSSLIYINPDGANKFTKALSKTYRYVLSLTRQPVVSVAEELDALDAYIFMMRTRFENAFTFTVDKAVVCEQHQVIPLTLQLLIENAFKHNSATEESQLHIKITIDSGYITVENNIQPSTPADKGGVGLKYLAKQYKMYGKEVIVAHTEHVFMVKIPYIQS
ncbi:sensor histidine kinase [Parapedobacter indicus]|uniref:Histidine kinase n=1 Tax=Parapedobacter indicus TaxID=1477437 RepID=A0A1I3GMK9_9SPHI|nr:sensor histidine kinase [Parapedobacter indicus]PPL02710.1 histidine kinase [Parapedobacter indicus]SFI24636.1 Histidine kinase [Parapedobacter indicus]